MKRDELRKIIRKVIVEINIALTGCRSNDNEREKMIENQALDQILELEKTKINKKSRWYKNCKRQRKCGAKICNSCPFKKEIEQQEVNYVNKEE